MFSTWWWLLCLYFFFTHEGNLGQNTLTLRSKFLYHFLLWAFFRCSFDGTHSHHVQTYYYLTIMRQEGHWTYWPLEAHVKKSSWGPKFYDWVVRRWTGATTELSVQDLRIKDSQGYSTFVLKPKMDGSVCLSVSWGKVAVHFLGWPPALASWILRTAGMYMPPVLLLENILLRIFDRLIHRSLCWDRQ